MTQVRSSHASPLPGLKSLFMHWLTLGLLGLILPVLVYFIARSNYFVQWHLVAQAPPATTQIIIGDFGGLLVRDASGQVFSFNFEDSDCWHEDNLSTQLTREPCDLQSVPFNPLAHPPSDFVDCASAEGGYAEMSYTVLYALDYQGNIWKWEKTTSAYEILLLLALAVAGGVAGILLCSIIWVVRRIRAGRKTSQKLSP